MSSSLGDIGPLYSIDIMVESMSMSEGIRVVRTFVAHVEHCSGEREVGTCTTATTVLLLVVMKEMVLE